VTLLRQRRRSAFDCLGQRGDRPSVANGFPKCSCAGDRGSRHPRTSKFVVPVRDPRSGTAEGERCVQHRPIVVEGQRRPSPMSSFEYLRFLKPRCCPRRLSRDPLSVKFQCCPIGHNCRGSGARNSNLTSGVVIHEISCVAEDGQRAKVAKTRQTSEVAGSRQRIRRTIARFRQLGDNLDAYPITVSIDKPRRRSSPGNRQQIQRCPPAFY
jgi:hypothetical protein